MPKGYAPANQAAEWAAALGSRIVDQLPDLDRRLDGEADLLGPFECRAAIGGYEEIEASEVLLGLEIGPIRRLDSPSGRANDRGLAGGQQPAAEPQRVGRAHLLLERVDL